MNVALVALPPLREIAHRGLSSILAARGCPDCYCNCQCPTVTCGNQSPIVGGLGGGGALGLAIAALSLGVLLGSVGLAATQRRLSARRALRPERIADKEAWLSPAEGPVRSGPVTPSTRKRIDGARA